MLRLIWIRSVCLWSFYGYPAKNGLKSIVHKSKGHRTCVNCQASGSVFFNMQLFLGNIIGKLTLLVFYTYSPEEKYV